ncbi:hypothetical protein [Streptomyces sp. NPDC058583]|uniref:hypothetical protein n=1 Tax=unclassified Streptomyces TaxID=2593676 RepID=UPI003663C203
MPERVPPGDAPPHASASATATATATATAAIDPADPADFDDQDEELIAYVLRRVQRARGRQLNRRAAGLPATTLAGETEMLRHYTARLGRPGTDIARALLALARHRPGPPSRADSADDRPEATTDGS